MASKMEMMQLVMTRECLRKQIEEYELLQSMYSNPGEFQSDNPYLVNDIGEFLAGNRGNIAEKLDFRIKLQMTERVKMELSVILSQYYPSHEQPMFIIRTDSLSKQQEKAIKSAMEKFIESEVDKSEPYIYQVISWLQDNINELVQMPIEKSDVKEVEEEKTSGELKRIWLWSHHIYSKIKRQNIMKLAKDHDLYGFMWPGKPGVICFEGTSESVEEVVKIVKGWQWQKLKIVLIESSEENAAGFISFAKFNEILTSEVDGEIGRMDSGEFFKYLESHNAGHMKKELFGFE
jgi:acylphosphatase